MDNLTPPGGIRRIEANRTLKDALEAAVQNHRVRERLSVTDLINPMQAYFQRTRADIQIPLERLQLMWTGTGFHNTFGAAVSSEEFLEQFVEKDGVVGKIDIYDDLPIELKTSASLPEDLLVQRSSYVEQLGMYCYMSTQRNGAVVVYRREEYGREPALRCFRVEFQDLESVGQRMRERRDLLLEALGRKDPSRLGQCEWWGRRCDYQDVCACAAATRSAPVVAPDSVSITEDSDMERSLLKAAKQWRERPSWAISFNDVVFPRRGVLLRTVGRSDDDDEDNNLGELQRSGFFSTLTSALRYGEPGAYSGKSVALDTVRGVVRMYREVPTIVRSTNTYRMIERDRLFSERPYWIDRLALETALVGSDAGRLVVYYPRLEGGDKFMVYDLGFKDLELTIAEAKRRLDLFANKAEARAFPVCGPDWMPGYCPFKDNCACK